MDDQNVIVEGERHTDSSTDGRKNEPFGETSIIDRTILTLCQRILHKTSHRILLKRVLNQATRRTSIIEAGGLQTSVMTVWQAKTYATHIPDHPKRAHRPALIEKALMDLPEAPATTKGTHESARGFCRYKRRSWICPRLLLLQKALMETARGSCRYKRHSWKLPEAQHKS